MSRQGLLIAFEGIDGTGKSTQLALLADFLRSRGCEVVQTREPTDGEYGRRIRELYQDRGQCTPEEELELFTRDRRQHVRDCIEPALAAGRIVLTDRYYFSTVAYQGAAGCDPEQVFAANSFAPEPDLVLLLTMEPEQSLARIRELRGDTLNDFEQLDQLRRVARLFASFRHRCITRIDAAAPLDRVQAEIRRAVLELMDRRGYRCST
ncbi:MAG TPA: dTMP kinase [Desulfobulbus sp.]|nr:dTMP kinase [Desulfobulbus sp.]